MNMLLTKKAILMLTSLTFIMHSPTKFRNLYHNQLGSTQYTFYRTLRP